MKNYKVEVKDVNQNPIISESVKAANAESAYEIFVSTTISGSKKLPFRNVYVSSGMFDSHFFEPPHYEGHLDPTDEQSQQRDEEEKKKLLERKAQINNLTEKISSDGFSELSAGEISIIADVVDEVFLSDQLSEDELKLAQATLSDEQAYRFFSLRSNSRTSLQQQAMLEAMNVNLSDISKKTSGVRGASMFTGLVAARHLGEEIAEDIESGDDGGGGLDDLF